MKRVLIVGGGAAGMFAAAVAAQKGCEVFLFEKNEKLGKKLYITGKGRCNVTNDCGPEELLSAVVRNRKFLYSAFYTFGSRDKRYDGFPGKGGSSAEDGERKQGFSGVRSFF